MTLDWSTRGALRLYPQRWRNEFEQEVIGTLLDVAEAEKRTRPPLRELIPLAFRGAWMRARSSVVFWTGLAIIAVMIWGVGQAFDGFLSERYWPVMLSRAGTGLVFALPLAGASAAWQAGRRRATVPLRQRLRTLAADGAGPAIFVGIGYLAAVGVQLAASGWPVTVSADLRIPLTYFCMLLAALGVGSLAGTVVRGALAAPISLIALGLWYLLPFSFHREWGNVTGTMLVSDNVPGLEYSILPSAVILVSVAAIAITALAVALIVVKVTKGWLWFAVILALSFVAVVANARAISGDWPASPYADRTDELICDGVAPRICLWPEQEAEAGELVRSTLAGAYEKALTLGIPVSTEIGISYRLAPSTDQIIANYSQSLMLQFACNMDEHPELSLTFMPPEDRYTSELSARFALGLALGADPSSVWHVYVGGDASGPPTRSLTLAETKDYFDVHDLTEAKAAILAWAERGPTCE